MYIQYLTMDAHQCYFHLQFTFGGCTHFPRDTTFRDTNGEAQKERDTLNHLETLDLL